MRNLTPNMLAIAISMALSLSSGAYAQSGPTEEDDENAANSAVELDNITVTSRRMRETLQEVPLPVTAISEQTIEDRGFLDVKDIANFSPGFSFRSAFGRTGDRPVIRGMSNIQGQPNASFFVDGVFVSGSISGYNLDNLERVEVIRGPQSALFGRRTFSGAVNFITRKPLDFTRARVSLSAGGDGYGEFTGMWSGPLIEDRLGLEVNAAYRNVDGRFFNSVSGTEDIGGERTESIGAALSLRNDSIDAVLRMNYVKNDDQHPAIFRQGSNLNNCFLPQPAVSRLRGYFCGTLSLPETFGVNTPQYAAAGFPAGLQRESLRSSLSIDWTLANNWMLSSISAYNDTELYSAIDQDFSNIRGFGGAFETFDQSRDFDYSQELRLSSDTSRPVYGMIGAYYYKEFSGEGFSGSLAGFGFAPGGNPPIANPRRPQGGIENTALFGLIEWRINEQWRTSAELRRAEDRVSAGGTNTTVLNIGGVQTPFSRSFSLNEKFTSTTPRLTLSYQASDTLMWYGLASQGTKPGGFNGDVQNPVLTDAARAELVAAGFETFEEEKAWNYEIGFKSDWADNTFRLNGALFFIDWDNQQLTETRPVDRVDGLRFITSFTSNVGKSRVQGLELESYWQPADGWLINANYTYLDAEIREYFSQDQADLFDGNGSAAGNTLPRVPKHSVNLGAYYEGRFNTGWGWFAGTDVAYESSRYAQIHNLAETGDSTKVNFRTGLRPSQNWTITAWVRNAFDDDTPEDILRYINPAVFIPVPNLPGLSPPITATTARDFALTAPEPRTYGISVTYHFD